MSNNTVSVSNVEGKAWVKAEDGSLQVITKGMSIPQDAVIVTAAGAKVELAPQNNPAFIVGSERELALTADVSAPSVDAFGNIVTEHSVPELAAIESLENKGDIFAEVEAPAATQSSGGSDNAGGSSFTRLESIVETTKPLDLAYPRTHSDHETTVLGGSRTTGEEEEGEVMGQVSITIDPITGDDLVDAQEREGNVTITGKLEGDVSEDAKVTVTVNGKDYDAEVNVEDKTWEVDVPGSELEQDTEVSAKVESKDEGGNEITDETERPYEVPELEKEPEPEPAIHAKLTLDAAPVNEGEDITITASVDNAPKTDLIITLGTGVTITIAAGELEGSVTFENPNKEDVYIDASTETYTVTTSGGGYASLSTPNEVRVKVSDTIDDTTLTLTAEQVFEGEQITITATVDNAPETDLVITLDNGEQITILAGELEGKVTFDNPIVDDVYAEADRTVEFTVETTEGGNYENLVVEGPVEVTVTDEVGTEFNDPTAENEGDKVYVTLSADNAVEGQEITVKATVLGNDVPKTDLVITLNNGEQITILAGELTGEVSFANPNTDDVYVDPSKEEYTVTKVEGGGFENVIVEESVTVDVADTIDGTELILLSNRSVVEEGEAITIEARLTNPTETDMTITLDNGEVIFIPAGGDVGQVTFDNPFPDDVYTAQEDREVKVNVSSTEGGNFEQLDVNGPATIIVTDQIEGAGTVTSITLSADDVLEGEDITITATVEGSFAPLSDIVLTLDNGEVIVIKEGEFTGSVTFANPNTEDVHLDSSVETFKVVDINGDGQFEETNIEREVEVRVGDTIDDTILTLSANPIAEGEQITITASVGNAPQTDLEILLDNGEVITILAGDTSGSVSFDNPIENNVFEEADRTLEFSVDSTSGGNYENLVIGSPVEVIVTDESEPNAVTITLSADAADVEEGKDITITATVEGNDAPISDITITLDNGEVITIKAGELSGDVTFTNPNQDDVYVDPSAETFSATDVSGGGFEKLEVGNSVSVNVVDTIDDTTLTLTAEDVEEGEQITVKATVDNAPQSDLTITLDNGEVITILAGETKGEVTFDNPIADNVYEEADRAVDIAIESVTGGEYENLLGKDQELKVGVTDDPASQANKVQVTLSADKVEEGADITVTATLEGNNAPKSDITITLDNGEVIVIKEGEFTGSVSFDNPNADDAYVDPSIEVFDVAAVTGGGFENLVVDDSVSVEVVDTIDDTTITLNADAVEEGKQITVKATVDNAPQTDLSITLDNGEVITILAGETEGEVSFDNPIKDNVYIDSDRTVSVGVESTSGGNYENLVDAGPVDVTVTDEAGSGTRVDITLEAGDVVEGKDITITAKVQGNDAPKSDITIELDNGETITILAGELEGSTTFTNPNQDDVYVDPSSEIYSVTNVSGNGGYENLVVENTVTVKVSDTIDDTTLTLTGEAVVEGEQITIKATVDNAPQSDLTITLDNGEVITILAGETDGEVAFDNPIVDNVYEEADRNLKFNVTSTDGGNYENLVTGSVTVKVTDEADLEADGTAVKITLTTEPVVDEGDDITILARLEGSDAPKSDVTITLDNGEKIIIREGEFTGSVTFENPNKDDAYIDPSNESFTVTDVTGGGFEKVVVDNGVSVDVIDTIDDTSLVLSADPVDEGKDITITATVDNAPQSDLTITLDNGEKIIITAGDTSGSVTFENPIYDNVYEEVDRTLEYKVTDTDGGNYENLVIDGPVDVTVSDEKDGNEVKVSLTTDPQVEEGDDITITATLEGPNPPKSDIVIELDNGEAITIPEGEFTGSVTFENPNKDDVYVDPSSEEFTVTDVTGGGFENLVVDESVSTKVVDTIDDTFVTLSTEPQVDEGEGITIKAKIEGPNAPKSDVTITLDNGEQIVISAGEFEGSVTFENPNKDDAYVDPSNETFKVTDVTGGEFENLIVTNPELNVNVVDTIDDTDLRLSADTVEEGEEITITATVDNAPQTDLTITLDNGEKIIITAGDTSGSVTFDNPIVDNVYEEADRTLEYEVVDTEGGNYENLIVGGPVTVTVTDNDDGPQVKVTLSTDPQVAEGDDITIKAKVEGSNPPLTDITITLDNGEVITVKAGEFDGEVTFANPNQDDVYKDSSNETFTVTDVSGGGYEDLVVDESVSTKVVDTIDDSLVYLSVEEGSVEEGEDITIKATVDNAPQSDLTITLDNGEKIIITAGNTTGSVTFDNPIEDNVYVEADRTVEVGIESTSGGNYENLEVIGGPVTITVTDEAAPGTRVDITLDAYDVEEGEDITITATVEGDDAPKSDIILTLNNGKTITIRAGELEGEVTFTNPNQDDVYVDPSSETYTVTNVSGNGGYENLVVEPGVTVDISDTIDDTTLTLSADSVMDGEQITVKAQVDNAPQTDLTITLDNGKTITIKAGEFTGEVKVDTPASNNVYAGGTQTVDVAISDVTGGNYENLLGTDGSVSATVNDDPNKPGAQIDVILTADNLVVEGKAITITATVVGDHLPKSDITITLNNGEEIIIPAGESSGKVTFENPNDDDAFIDSSVETFTVVSVEGGGYKDLNVQQSVDVKVIDTLDPTTLELLVEGSVNVEEGMEIEYTVKLDNECFPATGHDGIEVEVTIKVGSETVVETVTIAPGETEATITFTPEDPDLIYVQDYPVEASITNFTELADANSGKQFESLELKSNDPLIINVKDLAGTEDSTVDGNVTEIIVTTSDIEEGDPTITFNFEATNPPLTGEATLKVDVDGDSYDVMIGADGKGSLTVINTNEDDVYVDSSKVTATVTQVIGGDYENVDLSNASATAQVRDTIDTTIATLSREQGEDSFTYTVTLTNKDGVDVTGHQGMDFSITDNMGVEVGIVTIEAGSDTGTFTTTDLTPTGKVSISSINLNNNVEFENLLTTGCAEVKEPQVTPPVVNPPVDLDIDPSDMNIAFMFNSAGSMSKEQILEGHSQIRSAINDLWDAAHGDAPGTINIYINDFDTIVRSSMEISINELGSKKDVLDLIDEFFENVHSGGAANYEAAFLDTAQWFKGETATSNVGANNLTFFITNGEPTAYFTDAVTGEVSAITSSEGDKITLADILANHGEFELGQEVYFEGKLIVDESGKVYTYLEESDHSADWPEDENESVEGQFIFTPDGKGGFILSQVQGDGSLSPESVDKAHEAAKGAFEELAKNEEGENVGTVTSIGIKDDPEELYEPPFAEDTLTDYDTSDREDIAPVEVEDLANSIKQGINDAVEKAKEKADLDEEDDGGVNAGILGEEEEDFGDGEENDDNAPSTMSLFNDEGEEGGQGANDPLDIGDLMGEEEEDIPLPKPNNEEGKGGEEGKEDEKTPQSTNNPQGDNDPYGMGDFGGVVENPLPITSELPIDG